MGFYLTIHLKSDTLAKPTAYSLCICTLTHYPIVLELFKHWLPGRIIDGRILLLLLSHCPFIDNNNCVLENSFICK